MEVGDSFWADTTVHAVCRAAGKHAKFCNDGRKYTARAEKGGVRVWRIDSKKPMNKTMKSQGRSGMPKVEKHIPIPEKIRNVKYPWMEMEIGDSFWTKASTRTVSQAASNHSRAHKNDRQYRCLPEGDGTRCWRIK